MVIIQIGQFPKSPSCIRGGVEASVYGLACELSRDTRNRVEVFDCPRIGGTDAVETLETSASTHLTIHRFSNPGSHNQDSVKAIGKMLADICDINPDICHIHGTNLFSSAIQKQLKKRGFKTILTVHGLLGVEKLNALRRHFSAKALYQYLIQSRTEKRLLRRSPGIIVDTEYVSEAIRHYGIRPSLLPAMEVIPQGIDNRYFTLQCSKESNLILSVGAFSRRKGHLYLLQAFDELCSKGIEARLMICGIVAENDYYRLMMDYVSQSPNKDKISIRPDLSLDELNKAYESAHIFALHSQEESQGIVLAEAMASGLPVVATRVGGIPYVVQDEKCGLLSAYSDFTSFAANISELLGNPEQWECISENAKKEARNFSWSEIATKISSLYTLTTGIL